MAKFTSGAKFTYFNILFCIAAVLVISTKEGMKKVGGVDPLWWYFIIFLILIGLNFIYQKFKEGVKEPFEYFNILKGM